LNDVQYVIMVDESQEVQKAFKGVDMIGFLVLVVLGPVVFRLYQRVGALERTIASLLEREESTARRAPTTAPERLRNWARDLDKSAPTVAKPTPVPEPEPASVRTAAPVSLDKRPQPATITAEAAPAPQSPPPPAPPPPASAPPASPPRAAKRIGFEELFGSKLPIWAGGITLAVAGLFIVKYSIDMGLLSPTVRVVLGLFFAAALVVAGEFTRTWKATAEDPRVSQALAGAGIASAYAAILMATNVYELIAPATGFVGLAAVTAGALGLALRFGPPSAVLGLVGGLSAPALVGAAPGSVTLLATYLMLTILGLAGVGRRQGWSWLAAAALAGGFGWGAIMLGMNLVEGAATTALGSYLLLLALVVPLIAGEDRRGLVRMLPMGAAAVQIAILVASGGYTPFVWGFYALLSIGAIVLARTDVRQAMLPPLALLIGLATVALWFSPPLGLLMAVLVSAVVLFGGSALAEVWSKRGTPLVAGQASIAVLGSFALGLAKTVSPDQTVAALIALAVALPFAAVAWRGVGRAIDARFAILSGTVTVLVGAAALLALPVWSVPPVLMAIALMTALVAMRVADARLAMFARAAAAVALATIALDPAASREILRALGDAQPTDMLRALWRYGATAMLLAPLAWVDRTTRSSAQSVSALLVTVAFAQFVPQLFLGAIGAAAAFAAIAVGRKRADLRPAALTFAVVAAAWSAEPVLLWFAGAMQALAGVPLFVTTLPAPDIALLRMIVPAALLALAAGLSEPFPQRRVALFALGGVGLAGAFVLAKQVFAIADPAAFVALGMAERVAFTTVLFAGGWLALREASRASWLRGAGLALTGVALARTLWFDVGLYNPVWFEQAVGGWPFVNLLVPAYLLPIGWLALAAQREPELRVRFALALTGVQIALILVFAFATVRQLFHGAILTGVFVSSTEDIARSLAAVALSLGFLRWGIAKRDRPWRIASLILMLGAVFKVFVFDASGLDGLLRILSFVALGFSLIGIGWLYTRYLKADAETVN